MGMSWVLDGKLTAKSKNALGVIDPAAFDDWPEELAPDGKPMRGTALLARLAKEPRATVTWKGTTLTVRAIVVNDGSFWADLRVHLATLFREQGGEVLIGAASDNATGFAVNITKDACAVLRGKALAAAEKRLRAVEDALPTGAPKFVVDPALRPIHAKILKRLRALPESALLAAAAQHPDKFGLRTEQRDLELSKLYPNRASLIAALEGGDPRIVDWNQIGLVCASLAVLANASPDDARGFARDVLTSGTKNAAIRQLALTLTADFAEPDFRALRASLPNAAFYGALGVIAAHPMVKELSRRKESGPAVRAELAKTVGKPPSWKKLTGPATCLAAALALVLRAHKRAEDRSLLAGLKTHPEPLLQSV